MIYQRRRWLREAATPCGEGWIKSPDAAGPGHRYHGDEWEPLIGVHRGIAHGDAWPHASLFVAYCWIQFDENNGPAFDRHTDALTQPCPSIQRTAVPLDESSSPSSSGSSEVQSLSSTPAICVVSG